MEPSKQENVLNPLEKITSRMKLTDLEKFKGWSETVSNEKEKKKSGRKSLGVEKCDQTKPHLIEQK